MTGRIRRRAAASAPAARRGPAETFSPAPARSGLALVPLRRLVVVRPRVVVPIEPGDRVQVAPDAVVAPGDLLVECIREGRLVEIAAPRDPAAGSAPGPGAWIPAGPERAGRRGGATPAGELIFEVRDRRRLVSGPHPDRLEAPIAGRVVDVQPGAALVLDLDGVGLPGMSFLGSPVRGRLVLLPGEGDSRPALDVASAGAIVVLGSRADVETLTRARAMGIHGAVVAALSDRDRRDFAASAARQRAGLHGLAPFGVLVLDGTIRRPIPGPIRAILGALAGGEVGLVGDPPLLVASPAAGALPVPAPDHVRLRGGEDAGCEGRWLGPAGIRRLRLGVTAECGLVALDDGRTVVVPVGDVERFA